MASLDADNDGASNGVELRDRFGDWRMDQDQPRNSTLIIAPGNAASNNLNELTVQFSNMILEIVLLSFV